MKLEFQSKTLVFELDGSPSATRVLVGNSAGAVVPVDLPPDRVNLTNSELFEQAMEQLYQENFPQRAENEKFNTIGERIAKFDAMIEAANKTIEKMEEQVSLSAASRSAFLRVVMALYQKGMLSDEELVEMGLFDDEDIE